MKTRDGHHVINFNTLNVIQSLKILVTDDIVLDCCLISSEQFFNYILDKTNIQSLIITYVCES